MSPLYRHCLLYPSLTSTRPSTTTAHSTPTTTPPSASPKTSNSLAPDVPLGAAGAQQSVASHEPAAASVGRATPGIISKDLRAERRLRDGRGQGVHKWTMELAALMADGTSGLCADAARGGLQPGGRRRGVGRRGSEEEPLLFQMSPLGLDGGAEGYFGLQQARTPRADGYFDDDSESEGGPASGFGSEGEEESGSGSEGPDSEVLSTTALEPIDIPGSTTLDAHAHAYHYRLRHEDGDETGDKRSRGRGAGREAGRRARGGEDVRCKQMSVVNICLGRRLALPMSSAEDL